MPMGISCGRTALVIVSALKSKIAPIRRDTGIRRLLSGPVTSLTIWGIRRPIKPIIPDTETAIAANIDPVTNKIKVTFLVSTPRLEADLGPREIKFKSLANKSAITKPIIVKIQVIETSIHVFEAKLPISQNIITETCSSAMYFKKLIPAESIAATIIPDKIRLLDERVTAEFLPEYERNITKKSVRHAPAKANKGTDTNEAPRFKIIAAQAPKAAPADTPKVYGSARGFKSMP